MRFFFSEFANIYETYTFAYAAYAIAESPDELSEIYRRGFLPYSGDSTETQEMYYLARSVRVNLETFAETSENRRVGRKIEPFAPRVVVHAKADFDLENEHFRNLCLSCSEERFRGGGLSEARFDYILRRDTLTHIAAFHLDQVQNLPVGYVFCALVDDTMLHYWFAFYDTQHAQLNLGKWMMATMLRVAKDNGLRYAYLGTAYGAKSLYKTADFKGIEWFNGDADSWSGDAKALADLCRQDDARSAQNADELPKSDRYKQQRSSKTKDEQTNHDEPAN